MKVNPVERMRRLPLWQPLAVRDFRLLWLGQGVSLFGDQFYLVALYWLTLKLSDSGFTLGTVLMAASATQAIFQLLGGAIGDRLSPRALMLGSDLLRALITLLITIIVYLNVTELWHLYVLAALFGAVEAFFYPAYMSAIPMLVLSEHLPAGNALLRGTSRLMGFIGSPLAGLVISSISLAAAFGIDSLTFIFAAITLWMIRIKKRESESSENEQKATQEAISVKGLIKSIGEGLRYSWSNKLIRSLLLLTAAIEFSFVGPSSVGLSVMASRRFGDASALGWMLGSLGGGMLVGIILAGSMSIKQRRGRMLIFISLLIGLGLTLLSFATHVLWASLILAIIGLGGGLANIILLSWMQSSTEPRVLGRVMSLMMFSVAILEPASFAISGVVADINLTAVFITGGAIMIAASILAFASNTMRNSD